MTILNTVCRCATFQNECRPVLEKYAGSLVKVTVTTNAEILTLHNIVLQVDAGQDKETVAAEIEAAF